MLGTLYSALATPHWVLITELTEDHGECGEVRVGGVAVEREMLALAVRIPHSPLRIC